MTPRRLDPETKRAEFEALALPCMGALFCTAARLAHGPDDAEDLVQETFLRAYRTYENFQPGTNAKAWLFTILYSVFTNQYRRAKRAPSVPIEEIEHRLQHHLEAPPEGPDLATTVEAWGTRLTPEIETALKQLPEDFRAPVLLVDLQDLSYGEAAAALGVPLGTVRSRLFRARRLLLAALRSYAAEMGHAEGDP
jgi:RNA polymerase sigma-70 factor (ECF subfamily)